MFYCVGVNEDVRKEINYFFGRCCVGCFMSCLDEFELILENGNGRGLVKRKVGRGFY